MGTPLARRDDTPVEFVEVPLLSALGVMWGRGYDHAFVQITSALQANHFGFQWRPWIEISKRKGCDITVAVTTIIPTTPVETSVTRHLRFVRFESDMAITPEPAREFVHIPSSVLQLRVSIDPNKISEDERAQLGLEVTR